MNLHSTVKHRTATLNVPCTGVFTITVCSDGYWEVKLVAKDGNTYYRSRGTMLRSNLVMDHRSMTSTELPQFMWDTIDAKIDELTIMFNRDSLDAPVSNGVTV